MKAVSVKIYIFTTLVILSIFLVVFLNSVDWMRAQLENDITTRFVGETESLGSA